MLLVYVISILAEIYLLKVNDRNIRAIGEIYSKWTIMTLVRHELRCFSVFIISFEQVSFIVFGFSMVNFEEINAGWVWISSQTSEWLTWASTDKFFKVKSKGTRFRPTILWKDPDTGVLLRILGNCSEQIFHKTPVSGCF